MIVRSPARLAAGLCALTLAAGCTTDDPSRGGFLGGVGGLVTGDYAKANDAQLMNLQTRRAQLEADRAVKAQAERDTSTAQDRVTALSRDVSRLDRETRTLVIETAEITAKGGAAAVRSEAMRIELADLRRDLARIKKSADAKGDCDATCSARRSELEARIRAMELEVKALR